MMDWGMGERAGCFCGGGPVGYAVSVVGKEVEGVDEEELRKAQRSRWIVGRRQRGAQLAMLELGET